MCGIMARLIDEDTLLQKFNDTGIQITFDLPVEEILGADIDIDDFTMLVQDVIQSYRKMVIGTIKDMPTAYDVEKAEKEKKALQNRCRALSNGELCCSCPMECERRTMPFLGK